MGSLSFPGGSVECFKFIFILASHHCDLVLKKKIMMRVVPLYKRSFRCNFRPREPSSSTSSPMVWPFNFQRNLRTLICAPHSTNDDEYYSHGRRNRIIYIDLFRFSHLSRRSSLLLSPYPPPTSMTAPRTTAQGIISLKTSREFHSTDRNTNIDKWRDRADDMRTSARQRAEHLRDSAQQHMRDFREHPAQSARQGAHSMGAMFKKYGPVFVGTYFTVYMSTLAALFAGVETGVLDPVVLFSWLGQDGGDGAASTVHLVVDWMKNHTFTEPYASYVEKNPSVANLAVAWIAVKFTEPIRFAVTLALTPRVARSLGYRTEQTDSAQEETGERILPDETTEAGPSEPASSPDASSREERKSL